ncbi:MAG: type III-B CRISPR-associated protein Cas10/Cmr2 [Bacillota bacterium]|nr:type III-B CRISPR-associated protein Cas10/Cmr2 [Bacillota bacterium]
MSGYLLSVALGPVQDFIAAARRTHDLWFGSHLLSEISKAAALSLHRSGATLIFPAPERPEEELSPGSQLNVANKLLAQVPEGLAPEELARSAQEAAKERWKGFAADALRNIGSTATLAIRLDVWEEQLKDVLEFYAAWVPMGNDYIAARTRVERLLAGRKALRDFLPVKGRAKVPKSSLDGARETVLNEAVQDKTAQGARLRRELRLKQGEQLDAIGLIKRRAVGGAREGGVRFVSVSRVAADVWIRRLWGTQGGRELLRKVEQKCHPDFADPIDDPVFRDFPRECEVLFESRRRVMMKEADLADHLPALGEIDALLRSQKEKVGQPSPYLAILKADGDRMGSAISNLRSPEEHRRLSRQLARFAAAARAIVAECHGSLVYSGGDDVLAFLPLDTCLLAARRLHDEFGRLVGEVAPEVTLSAGVSVGHCLEPLEDLLTRAKEAERNAKEGAGAADERDGLAVSFWTRGGSVIKARAQWGKNLADALDARLQQWIDLFRVGALPDKAAYDLRALAREYERWEITDWPESQLRELLQADALRLLRRKQAKDSGAKETLKALLETVKVPADLTRLADEVMVARRLAVELPRVEERSRGSSALEVRGEPA